MHAAADLDMAQRITLNAKMRRPGVCGSAETLLVDRAVASTHLAPLVKMLLDAGCAVRGDGDAQKADPRVTAATEEDWRTEYLDRIISARVVDDIDAAISHIGTFGSHHTDAIVTADNGAAEKFMREVDWRLCCITHRRNSRMAANSVSARRSALRRGACMQGARLASSS